MSPILYKRIFGQINCIFHKINIDFIILANKKKNQFKSYPLKPETHITYRT